MLNNGVFLCSILATAYIDVSQYNLDENELKQWRLSNPIKPLPLRASNHFIIIENAALSPIKTFLVENWKLTVVMNVSKADII